MTWSILFLLAVLPLFALVVFGVYKLATARHVGFWLLTILWSAALTTCCVLAAGFAVANSRGSFVGMRPHHWMELLGPFTVLVIGGLALATFVRRLVVGRSPDVVTPDREPPAAAAVSPGPYRPAGSVVRGVVTMLSGFIAAGFAVFVMKQWPELDRLLETQTADAALRIKPVAVVLMGLLPVWLVVYGVLIFRASKPRPTPATSHVADVGAGVGPSPELADSPAAATPEPSAVGFLFRFAGWTAAVVGFIAAWVWGVCRYADGKPDAPAITVLATVGLLILAVAADFVRGLLHRRLPGEPRRWYFLSPAGGTFTGRLLIGGVLLAMCVGGTIAVSQVAGFDLNMLNHPPPASSLPYLRFVATAVCLLGMGVGVSVTTIRRMDAKGQIGRPAKRALATGVPVAVILVGMAAAFVMVSEGMPALFPTLTTLASVFAAIGLGFPLHLWAYPEWWEHRRRLLRPEQASADQPNVRPLTSQQRKVLFWVVTGCLAFGVFVLIDPPHGLRRPDDVLLALAAVLCAGFGIRSMWKWAYRGPVSEPAAAPAGPLPVAPLVLTPDPTPVKGDCPTCGSPIPAGSPQGLCPRCLIRGVMQSANATRARSTRPIDPPPAAEVNEFFPHLEVLDLIGAGGMGAVYKVRQPALDRVVALKIVQSPTGDDDPVFAERFAREARAMAKLDHPNIVTIHESGEAGGLPYLVMEFVDGITLREAMADHVLTTAEALAVIPQICDALDYAHRNGVVHRDIKPENILIDQTGRVKIADFGLAKLAGAGGVSLTHTRQAMGTPHYMAPEQWEKPNAVDHRADIYALGVVLYELLTGELPLGRFDLPSAKGKGNARMDEIILRALAKEPGQRYQHAGEVKTALSGIDTGGRAARTPKARRKGYEFRSKAEFLGWPLVHVVANSQTNGNTIRTARGWIAVGDLGAIGAVAVSGGFSIGLISVGGVISVGGLFALGGAIAAAGVVAVGGAVSAGLFAVAGATAAGKFAIGGGHAVGEHVLTKGSPNPGFGEVLWAWLRGLWPFGS